MNKQLKDIQKEPIQRIKMRIQSQSSFESSNNSLHEPTRSDRPGSYGPSSSSGFGIAMNSGPPAGIAPMRICDGRLASKQASEFSQMRRVTEEICAMQGNLKKDDLVARGNLNECTAATVTRQTDSLETRYWFNDRERRTEICEPFALR